MPLAPPAAQLQGPCPRRRRRLSPPRFGVRTRRPNLASPAVFAGSHCSSRVDAPSPLRLTQPISALSAPWRSATPASSDPAAAAPAVRDCSPRRLCARRCEVSIARVPTVWVFPHPGTEPRVSHARASCTSSATRRRFHGTRDSAPCASRPPRPYLRIPPLRFGDRASRPNLTSPAFIEVSQCNTRVDTPFPHRPASIPGCTAATHAPHICRIYDDGARRTRLFSTAPLRLPHTHRFRERDIELRLRVLGEGEGGLP